MMEFPFRLFLTIFIITAVTVGSEVVPTVLAISATTPGSNEELFTAQVELEGLFDTEQGVIEVFERYVAKEEARLREIKRRLHPFIETRRKSKFEVVGNPINAFLLLKGLTIDLDDLLAVAEDQSNDNLLKTEMGQLRAAYRFPTNEDLNGASVALTRLQETYLLDTSKMALGELDGHCCATKLNADDCFELGRQSYNSGDHEHTILWMNEALSKTSEERSNGSNSGLISQADILEYLAFSTYQKGEVAGAIRLTEQLLQLEPNHPRASGNIVHYEKLLVDKKGEDGGETDKTLTIRERRADQVGFEKANYEALCRGERQVEQKGTKCRYASLGKPYFLIGPLKQEIVSLKPYIYIYHQVIFDKEIEPIKKLAQPRFKRATVHNHVTGELVTAQYRISKSSWLQSGESPEVEKVNTRVSEITGLELATAEELQVVNYGLAGHYEPHFDFARRDEKDAFKTLGTGNRIATFLFYMSDVLAGGGTVFPQLGLTIYPQKGSAAFWYNLREDGTGDYDTRHAACPILMGSKWVANKWIHERGQEFRRPCKLNPAEPRPPPFES